MQKFVKQVMVVGAVVGMGISACTTLVNADGHLETQAEVELSAGGDIEIKSAPTITFEDATLNGGFQTLKPKSMGDPLKVVNPGQNTTWHVQARMDELTGKNTKSQLAGGRLTWYPGEFSPKQDASNLPTVYKEIVLNSAQAHIMDTEAGKGVGTFSVDPGTAKLDIAENAVADSYSATITWTLVNGDNGIQTPKQ